MNGPIMVGAALETFNTLPRLGCELLAAQGNTFARYWLCGHQALRGPGDYDWSRVDSDMNAMSDAGLEIYVNLMWLAPTITGGFPSLLPYTSGCAVFNDPHDGSKGWRYADRCGDCGDGIEGPRHRDQTTDPQNSGAGSHRFTPEKPYCLPPNIPPVNSAAIFDFAVAFAQRYGPMARWKWTGAWNEPGGPWYWPHVIRPPYETAYDKLITEVVIPWTEGIRSVLPDMRFVGGEADTPGTMKFWLGAEQRSGKRLCDIRGEHAYGQPNFPADSFTRIGEYDRIADAHPGRERWLSEVGDNGSGKLSEWFEEMSHREWSGFTAVVLYPQGDGWWRPGTWDRGTPEPNEHYHAMRDAIMSYKRQFRRRRAVSH